MAVAGIKVHGRGVELSLNQARACTSHTVAGLRHSFKRYYQIAYWQNQHASCVHTPAEAIETAVATPRSLSALGMLVLWALPEASSL